MTAPLHHFDDITPTYPPAVDELERELEIAAVQLVVMFLVVFCLAFGLGYVTGMSA